MRKLFKSALSVTLVLIMMVAMIPVDVFAATPSSMIISASTKTALVGSDVDVDITLKNNPGVSSIGLNIAYDKDILSLKEVKFNSEMEGSTQSSKITSNPVTLLWVRVADNFNQQDVLFATLTFTVNENAPNNAVSEIKMTYDPDDVYNINEENIACRLENGSVTAVQCVPGDINGDTKVNNKDVSRLMQYLAHWDVTVNEPVLDVNGDTKINNKDISRLMQYLAHWDVEIFPKQGSQPPVSGDCNHQLIKHDAVAPECEKDGNITYWHCSVCNKNFKDVNGLIEVSDSDIKVNATGHNVVLDPFVPPTHEQTGLTEGSHCSVCGKVIKKQEVIPVTDNYIIYNIAGENEYLKKQEIQNSNPNTYDSNVSLTLKPISCPGYLFLGWYDLPAGSAAENIKKIPAGTSGEIELFAWWQPIEYDIEFKSDLIQVSSEKYTVEKQKVLPVPTLNGYIFAGWSDDKGNIVKTISKGTTGHKTYTANWISERNQAWSKTKISSPIVYEDNENDTIIFLYEIGEIRNVPLSVIHDFGKINSEGISKEVTKTFTKTISEEEMLKYTNTVAKATTDSFSWTLSDGWSEGFSVNESWCQEKGVTKEEANTYSKTDSNNWYVSSGSSGYDTTVTLGTEDKYDLNTTTNNKKTYDTSDNETYQDFSAHLDGSTELSVSAKGNVGVAKVQGGVKQTFEYGAEYGNGKNSTSHTGTEDEEGGSSQGGSISHTGTDTTHGSSWNSESGYGGSSSVSQSTAVSKAISEKICNQYGYGKSYIKNSEQSSSQGFSSSDSNVDEYSSAVTYSTITGEETTVTYSTSNTKSGYHRWIMAGTAHVFALVGYDIKTGSYFVNNYTVMDDEIHEFEDYSYQYASYDDNQNTVIPFEVPFEVEAYVADRVGSSSGLVVSKSGIITGYNGSDEYVLIPEYTVQDNRDGTKSVIKIVGLTENVFKENTNIKGIYLSDFITDIPNNAFKNCSNLEEVSAYSITSIGNNAFQNCIKLGNFVVGDTVECLGENSFSGLEKLTVYAKNSSIIGATVKSGAKKIVITVTSSCNDFKNTTLSLPSSTERFTFNGLGKTFENVIINSDAEKTEINRANFISSNRTPLKFSSKVVELNAVSVKTTGIALIMSADTTNLSILGTVSMQSDSLKAVLCKNLEIDMLDDSISSEIEILDKLMICGKIVRGNNFLKSPVTIETINEDTFNKFYNGLVTITFNANGGNINQNTIETYYGFSIGSLPAATKDYCKFAGWYTAKNGGEQITEDTVINSTENITLYAHWTDKPLSGWVKASDVPSGAKVENRKWTYNLREYTSSANSSLSGYTKYDTRRTSWGGTQGPVYYDPSNGVRNVWSESYVTSSNYKTVYHYYRYAANREGGWGSYQYTPSYGYTNYYELDTDSELEFYKYVDGYPAYKWWYSSSNYVSLYQRSPYTTQEWVSDNYGTRWYYQDPVYTYYYYRDLSKESTSYPAGNDISNVQEWVQYREK